MPLVKLVFFKGIAYGLILGFQIQEKDHGQWWDAFAHEFFDDDAKMSFLLFDDQTPGHHHRYSALSFGGLLVELF